MYTKIVTIPNAAGLHARPVSDLVACAKGFAARATLQRANSNDSTVSARSAIMLLSKGFAQGEQVEVSASGEDAEACVEAIAALIVEGFGEL